MRTIHPGIAITGALLWAAFAAAQESVIEEAGIEEPGIEMVRVVTGAGLQDDCLAPVAITRIDGLERAVSAKEFLIEPGMHTLNGRATLDTTKCHPIAGEPGLKKAPDLEVNLELGNTYFIAYDRSSLNSNEWKLVVWKVEQALPPGEPPAPMDREGFPAQNRTQ